jgi:CheY-like chemotaxis protein
MLEFCVVDTGVGIPAEKLNDIFKPFHQVHPSRDTHELGGTGLGLTISRRLVEMMGGNIWVESQIDGPNHGTTFRFTLPYHPSGTLPEINEDDAVSQARHAFQSPVPPLSDTSDSLSDPSTTKDQLGTKRHRVLVVDDNLVNLKLAVRLLQRIGYETCTAENGKAAIKTLLSDPSIALILMDKEMPVLDGMEATREIRRMESDDPKLVRMPIVALTAAAMSGDREACFGAGCDDYLTKPLDQKAVMEVLTKFVGAPPNKQ